MKKAQDMKFIFAIVFGSLILAVVGTKFLKAKHPKPEVSRPDTYPDWH